MRRATRVAAVRATLLQALGVLLGAVVLGSSSPGIAAARELGPYTMRELVVPRERAGIAWLRMDGDLRRDLVIVGDSNVTIELLDDAGQLGEPVVCDVFAEVGGALIDFADLDGDGRSEIVALHRTGVDRFVYDSEKRVCQKVGEPLLDGMRGIAFLHLATGDFLYDIDGDGDEDLVFPVDGNTYIYRNEKGRFERRGQVAVPRPMVNLSTSAADLGSASRARIEIPRLSIKSRSTAESRVEIRLGDGRTLQSSEGKDILVGEYSIASTQEDVVEEWKRRRGVVLRPTESLQAVLRDVDDDGVEDYTIVYRNRIWIYLAGARGVLDLDRAPDQLLKVSANDRVSVALLPLDDDTRPDLILFRYQFPGIARLAAALALGLSLEIEVLGYPNDGDPVFARRPKYRSTLVFKVPPLLRIAGQLDSLVEQFRDILRPMQGLGTGDFDGDGRVDVLRAAGGHLEVYLTPKDAPDPIELATARWPELLREYRGDQLVRKVLFDRPRKSVTIEEGLRLADEVIDALQAQIVRGREPEARVALPAGVEDSIDQLRVLDIDGDGRADMVVFIDPERPPKSAAAAVDATEPARASDPTQRVQTQRLILWLSGAAGRTAPDTAGVGPKPPALAGSTP
jgi:hypothetical protein